MFREVRDGVREDVPLYFRIGCWSIFLVVMVIVITAFSYFVWPSLNNFWIKGFRTTNEYRTTKEVMLFKYMTEYEKLDTKIVEAGDNEELVKAYQSQQKAIVEKMNYEATMIEESGGVVPSEISSFLRRAR